MGTLLIGIFVVAFIITICLWVQGIDYMKKNHPDYKGKDLFNEEDQESDDK
jgi:hypothetical protein